MKRNQSIPASDAGKKQDARIGDGTSPTRLEPTFATTESYRDCADKVRRFEVTVHELPGHGFAARAREITRKAHGGYEFSAFAEASLGLALARVRGQIEAGISQRYLINHDGELKLPQQRLRGRIDAQGLVVDGELLDWEALARLLSIHEGFEFELAIPFEPDRWFKR